LSQSGAAPQRHFLANMLIFSGTSLPIGALGMSLAIYVQPHFAQDLGLGLVAIGAAFFSVRMIDIGFDLVLALGMDRTRTRFGRYRVWLLLGAPIMMLGVYQLFMAPKGIGSGDLILWLLVYSLGNSIYTIARYAWSAKLVTRYEHRSTFFGVLAAVGVIGAVAMLVTAQLTPGASLDNAVHRMGWIVIVAIPIVVGLTAWLIPETVAVDPPRANSPLSDYLDLIKRPELIRLFVMTFGTTLGPGWMSNLYIFFFTAARGFTNQQASFLLIPYVVAGALGAPLVGLLAAKFSKHRTLVTATICYSLGLCTVLAVPKGDIWLSLPVMLWCGFWGNGFDLMTGSMMADVGDQVRLEQGKERMGLLYSIISLAGKVAAAGAVIIAYPILAAIGFIPKLGAHNSASAIEGLQLCFLIGPIFFVALGGACCIGWKLDSKRHATIRAELEARDALLAGGRVADDTLAIGDPVPT
jgi:Na+/melibiose symporter-like transporter